MKFRVKNTVFTAVFAALCCVATMIIIIPLPNGYVNLGDVFVLLAGWCLGPWLGGLASAIGCSIADMIAGYVIYAPVTFFVKYAVGVLAYFVWMLIKKALIKNKLDFVVRIISAISGELIMVLGYFLYESILYGVSVGVLALLGNALQGITCVVGGVLMIFAISNIKYFKTIFPYLTKFEK